MSTIPNVPLNNGVEIPQVGFGVFLVPEEETKSAVLTALAAGYRHIDTARLYYNEAAVGQAVAESGIRRDEIFVTTKCWNSDQGQQEPLAAFEASRQRLGLDYLDLYLIHWPTPARDLYLDTWRAFEKLYADGRVRAIGVSNFQPAHLARLIEEADVVPAINQVELHPYLQQRELRDFHARYDIVTEAWSPLAKGGELLDDPTITGLAEKYAVTPAQIVLRWHLEIGNVVIPKSVHRERIASNLDLFAFELATDDVEAVNDLDRGERTGPDPDRFNRS